MNRKFLEAIRIIFAILAIILMIITIVMILMDLFGYGPTETVITFSALGILATLLAIIISVLFQIKGDIGSLIEFRRHTIEFEKQTIDKIKEIDIKFTNKLKEIETRLPKRRRKS